MPKRKNGIVCGGQISLPSCAVIFMLITGACFVPVALAQNQCEKELAAAELHYKNVESAQAIKLLTACLSKGGLSESEMIRAYRLLSLAYIATDSLVQAETAVERLLVAVPSYKPDPDDPPEYVDLVEKIKQKLSRVKPTPPVTAQPAKRGSSKKWLWIGLGTAALGSVAVAVLAGGEPPPDDEQLPPQKLPNPPGSPTEN